MFSYHLNYYYYYYLIEIILLHVLRIAFKHKYLFFFFVIGIVFHLFLCTKEFYTIRSFNTLK